MTDSTPPRTFSRGYASSLSTLSQSLSFHASPHAFLSERGQANSHGSPPVVAAKILNRNVAVFASHRQCREILGAEVERRSIHTVQDAGADIFAALPAYRQLMIDFFPQPNLLLLEEADHGRCRGPWDRHMEGVCAESESFIRSVAASEVTSWQEGEQMDIYERVKDMGWKLLLGVFLGLGPQDGQEYKEIVRLQEDLLRGQFSLFPVSISTPFWSSARSRGLNARKKLQTLLLKRLASAEAEECPFARAQGLEAGEMAANSLLFTSSIALKSLASLLTASLLNLYLFPGEGTLADKIRSSDEQRPELMASILKETERLSPPVVGVMRRVQQDIVVDQPEGAKAIVPRGWDAWLYFVGVNRNESVYPNGSVFEPERFMERGEGSVQEEPLAFGSGDKTCLGRDLVRAIVRIVCEEAVGAVDLDGQVDLEGVKGWLGWNGVVDALEMARDMKQLPCQRPREPIMVTVRRRV